MDTKATSVPNIELSMSTNKSIACSNTLEETVQLLAAPAVTPTIVVTCTRGSSNVNHESIAILILNYPFHMNPNRVLAVFTSKSR